LRHFIIRRLTFAAHLQASKSALTTSRYLRLVAMASVQIVGSITITSYNVWFTSMAIPIRPWTNWADVHSDFGRIDQFPIRFTPEIVQSGFYVVWWMVPIPTFLFVTFFAFGNDAIEEYKKCFLWIKEKVFRQSKSGEFTKAPKGFSFVKFSKYVAF
jgi:pheromone a factor receptor